MDDLGVGRREFKAYRESVKLALELQAKLYDKELKALRDDVDDLKRRASEQTGGITVAKTLGSAGFLGFLGFLAHLMGWIH